ncbi:terminase gpP N-terminus-related DNA-binding protein, partial [Burkholderia pseudomallei]
MLETTDSHQLENDVRKVARTLYWQGW